MLSKPYIADRVAGGRIPDAERLLAELEARAPDLAMVVRRRLERFRGMPEYRG